MAEGTGLRPVAEENGRSVEDPGWPVPPSHRYRVTAAECDKMAEILDKAGNLPSPTGSSEEGLSIGVGVSLEGVISDLLEVFGDIGTYGLLFKLAAFIKDRVEKMQDVEEGSKQVAVQAEFIRKSFEKVEIQFTLSDVSILEQAAETLCFCAIVLQRLGVRSSGACACLLIKLCAFLSASANQAELVTCEEKLRSFRENLALALQTRLPISDLPDLQGPPAVGIDEQIDEVLEFLGQTNSDQGVSCVVCFRGVKGVGKSRLMFEVQNRFPAKSTIDRFYTMNFAGASDPQSLLYLQQGLVEHLQGTGTAAALRSIDSGRTTIRRCLAFLKTKKKRVLFAFDNVGKAEHLTSILPLDLAEKLPAGSCILVSLANNDQILRAIKQVFPRSRTCQHKTHWVTPLKEEDAKKLFSLHAISLPKDESVVDKVVARCEGLPLLLKAVGQEERADWQAVLDALTRAEDVAQVSDELTGVMILPHAVQEAGKPSLDGTYHVAHSLPEAPNYSRWGNAALNKRLDSKLKVVFGALDEELQNALDDIGSLLSGWDWKTVEAILGTDLDHGKDLMKKLADRSLISPKVSKGGRLAPVANLTRYSGPGPWKTNVVAVDEHVLQPSNPVASLVELDHPEAVTLDRIQGVKYLVVHNSSLDGTSSRHLADLKFLYWSVSRVGASTSFTFPFQGLDVLPELKLLIISGNLDVQQFTIPSELPRLILISCGVAQELPEAIFVSRKLEELRLRDCRNLARLRLPHRNNHLQTLCLERCPALKTLPKAISGLRALQTLELLSCDGLEELEAAGVGSLTNLRALSVIGCNNLTALPDDLKNVSTLESLNLSFCSKLGELPQLGDGLGKLEELDLTGCSSIRKLSPDIKMLKSLSRLSLVACSNLVSLPDQIGELRNLQDLEMGFCIRVRNLPASLINLASLRRLALTSCSRLEELPEGLDALSSLEYLNLLGCRDLDVSKHAEVIQKLRNNKAVVHVEPSDLRTCYTGLQQGSRSGSAPYLSDPTAPVSRPVDRTSFLSAPPASGRPMEPRTTGRGQSSFNEE